MIWNFIIIGAIVIIFIILLRRLPLAIEMHREKNADLSGKELNKMGIMAQADEAYERGRFIEAEDLYVKAAAADPKNAKIYSRLGAIYLEQKNYYDSKEAFLQALKIDDTLPSRHINIGLSYMGLKDYFKASEAFRNALKLEPNNGKYQKLLEKAEKQKEEKNKFAGVAQWYLPKARQAFRQTRHNGCKQPLGGEHVIMKYHYTYALKLANGDLYIGSSGNLKQRLEDHRNGRVETTSRNRPLKLIYFEGCLSKKNAIQRENQLKTGYGRGYLKRRTK